MSVRRDPEDLETERFERETAYDNLNYLYGGTFEDVGPSYYPWGSKQEYEEFMRGQAAEAAEAKDEVVSAEGEGEGVADHGDTRPSS